VEKLLMATPRAALLVAAFLLVTGCSVLAGVDFGDVHGKDDGSSGGGGDDASSDGGATPQGDGSASVVEDGATIILADGGCAEGETTCNGVCVKKNDPQFGCGASACMPCSLPLTATAKCLAGQCVPDTCAQGRADCDGKPDNGCEADLSAPANCGSCTVQCTGSTNLCSPTGCVGACPGTTVLCGTSCVDTQTTVTSCGACNKVCNSAANSDPTCAGGVCGIKCHAGFQDCDNNAANGCEPLTTFYQDGDGDGVGGAASKLACTAPVGYKAAGGDCDDSNASVFPGQTQYFGAPYTNPGGAVSFDYDCDGNELESTATSTDHFIGSCAGACDNLGYLTSTLGRSGVGIDAYCGSTRYRECVSTAAPRPPTSDLPIGTCTSVTRVAAAVGCK
jgi:hypothetical protein